MIDRASETHDGSSSLYAFPSKPCRQLIMRVVRAGEYDVSFILSLLSVLPA